MHPEPTREAPADRSDDHANRPVTAGLSTFVVRNYDGTPVDGLSLRAVDAEGATAFRRTLTLGPSETVAVRTDLERAVYRVVVRFDGDSAAAECLLGPAPLETALVETGNGSVSVTDRARR